MSTIELTSEFEYFTIDRSKIIAHLVNEGVASDVTERYQRVVQRLAESAAGDTKHTGAFVPSESWHAATQKLVNAFRAANDFEATVDFGTLQFDSFASEDYGSYYVIDLYRKNLDRGKALNFQYLVILCEGPWVGNITHAFACDDLETVYEVIRPVNADVACENPDCHGTFHVEAGVWLVTDEGRRWEPETQEYDADGINCPFCTTYATGHQIDRPEWWPWELYGEGDAVHVENDLPAQRAPYKLKAYLHVYE